MTREMISRRQVVTGIGLGALAAALLPDRSAVAQAQRIAVFSGVGTPRPGLDLHVFGWGAQTAAGWTGRIVDSAIAVAERDFAGFAAGTTAIVPKGMANTINGYMDKDGIRGTSVCFSEVTDVAVSGSSVGFTARLTHAENPVIFKLGDPVTVVGDANTGEMTFTIRGGGKDNVFKLKGTILVRA